MHFESEAAESLNELRHKVFVELECENTLKTIEERRGQCTMSRTDLNDPRRFTRECSRDSLGDRTINQKVLTEAATLGTTHDCQISDFGFRISDLTPTRPKFRAEGWEIRNSKFEIRNFIVCKLRSVFAQKSRSR